MNLLGNRTFKAEATRGSGLDKLDVAVFTASCDDVETNKRFADALQLDYPILCDADGSVAAAYGILNKQRKIPGRVTFIIGADGKILSIERQVKTQSHGADIAAQLQSLGIAKIKKK